MRIPGKLKHVKAIGWYIEEYNMAQISMNLTNYKETPLHIAFDETRKSADERGVRVTGSELVGLIPLQALLDAGKFFLEKQGSSYGVSDSELIDCAIRSLGLNELAPFDPSKKIIEYLLKNPKDTRLVSMTVTNFANETASDSPAPGGGSIAALAGALGASLGTMVANLSAGKRGWEDRVGEFSVWAEKGQKLKDRLLFLVDEDTRAFDAIMQSFALPKDNPEQIAERKAAIQEASKYATLTPYYTMQAAYDCVELLQEMAEKGNPNSLSDVGVGALCIKTAVRGAWLNVITNATGLADKEWAADIIEKAKAIWKLNHPACDAIVEKIESRLLS